MRYANPESTLIDAGDGRFVPADPNNADFAAIVASGVPIEPYRRWRSLDAAKRDLAGMAQREAERRVALVSPPDRQAQHTALAVRLLDIASQRPLTPEEAQAQAWLRAASDLTHAIRLAEAAHQSAIAALPDLAAAEAYDLAAGWP